MMYVLPIDYSTKKLIAILSITGDFSKKIISDYKVVDMLYINENLNWIDLSIDRNKIMKDFEHDSYSKNDLYNEQEVIEYIFERGVE